MKYAKYPSSIHVIPRAVFRVRPNEMQKTNALRNCVINSNTWRRENYPSCASPPPDSEPELGASRGLSLLKSDPWWTRFLTNRYSLALYWAVFPKPARENTTACFVKVATGCELKNCGLDSLAYEVNVGFSPSSADSCDGQRKWYHHNVVLWCEALGGYAESV